MSVGSCRPTITATGGDVEMRNINWQERLQPLLDALAELDELSERWLDRRYKSGYSLVYRDRDELRARAMAER
jgi:hypothetical protein